MPISVVSWLFCHCWSMVLASCGGILSVFCVLSIMSVSFSEVACSMFSGILFVMFSIVGH